MESQEIWLAFHISTFGIHCDAFHVCLSYCNFPKKKNAFVVVGDDVDVGDAAGIVESICDGLLETEHKLLSEAIHTHTHRCTHIHTLAHM